MRMLSTWLLLGLCACSAVRMTRVEVESRPVSGKFKRVALAEPILLRDIVDTGDQDPFRAGVYVGNLVFSGGFVTEQHEVGLQNVSKNVALEAEDTYREQVADLVDGMYVDALDRRRKLQWQRVTLGPGDLVPHQMRPVRGTHEEDGHDNVCLPRFDLEPSPLPSEALSAVPDGVDVLIVPFVVIYYTHNGGWFLGQTYGNSAGARIRVFGVNYDPESGTPLGYMDATTRFLHEEVFQPNSSQLEDFAIFAEKAMEKQVRRHLFR